MTPKKRIGLYIDAENVSAVHAPAIVAEARRHGNLTIARCYGNTGAQANWAAAVSTHALSPVLTASAAKLKNASDFALIIDAVSDAHRDRFDAAVVASSDTAFTLLARHFREHAIDLHAVQEVKASPVMNDAYASVVQLDSDEFIRALLDIIPKHATMYLSPLGIEMRKRLGPKFPNGRLTTHIKRYPNLLELMGNTQVRRK